jgi:hypothetical protein
VTPAKRKSVNFNISHMDTEAMTKQLSASAAVSKLKPVTTLGFFDLRQSSIKVNEQHNSIKSSINTMIPQYALA